MCWNWCDHLSHTHTLTEIVRVERSMKQIQILLSLDCLEINLWQKTHCESCDHWTTVLIPEAYYTNHLISSREIVSFKQNKEEEQKQRGMLCSLKRHENATRLTNVHHRMSYSGTLTAMWQWVQGISLHFRQSQTTYTHSEVAIWFCSILRKLWGICDVYNIWGICDISSLNNYNITSQ